VRGGYAMFVFYVAVSGCAVDTERQQLGYGDYVGLSCDQLGQEAIRLMRKAADKSEHILQDDQARRQNALLQLKAVKQVRSDKKC
jgi:hypothetical protein